MRKVLSNAVVRQYIAGLICSYSLFTVGNAGAWSSPVIPILENSQLKMTDDEITWMVSLMYVGDILAAIPGAYLMDQFGRKTTLLVITVLPILSWVIIYLAIHSYQLYIARFLIGVHYGMSYTIVPVYIAEISEPHIRGSLGNMTCVTMYLGYLFEYLVANYLNYSELAIINLVVPVISFLSILWMTESPYFYSLKKNKEKAVKSLKYLRSSDDILEEMDRIDKSISEELKSGTKFSDLISTNGNIKALFIVLALCFFSRMSGVSSLLSYASVTFPKNSLPWFSVNSCVLLLSVADFIAVLASTFFVDRVPRKMLLIISCLGSGTCSLCAGIWYYLNSETHIDVSGTAWIPFVCCVMSVCFISAGLSPVATFLRGELFPANVKAKASAVCTLFLALMSFILNKIYLILAHKIGMYFNFLMYGTCQFISILFITLFVIETKGKTLQEIQDILNKRIPERSDHNNKNID